MLIAVVLVAGWTSRASGAAVIALNPQDPNSFYIYGHGYLDVGTGSVQVNSNHTAAALFQGISLTFIAGELNIVGAHQERGNPFLVTDTIHHGQPFLPDPLANLPAPDVDVNLPAGSKITGSGTFYPGYYPQGLELQSGNNVTLMPGLYVLDDGFELNGSATLHGDGVMFYIRSGGVADFGTGNVFLAPPSEGPYQGITFFQADGNSSRASFNGATTYSGIDDAAGIGTLYFPDATLELGGTGAMDMSGIIADKVHVFGDGVKRVIVPEPSLAGLLALAGAGLMLGRRR